MNPISGMHTAYTVKRYRNKAYINWIKTLPCSICRVEPCGDAHHLKGIGGMSGAGLTAPDWAAMPLCREHHEMMHAHPALWADQWEYIARTLGAAIEEGIIK